MTTLNPTEIRAKIDAFRITQAVPYEFQVLADWFHAELLKTRAEALEEAAKREPITPRQFALLCKRNGISVQDFIMVMMDAARVTYLRELKSVKVFEDGFTVDIGRYNSDIEPLLQSAT